MLNLESEWVVKMSLMSSGSMMSLDGTQEHTWGTQPSQSIKYCVLRPLCHAASRHQTVALDISAAVYHCRSRQKRLARTF